VIPIRDSKTELANDHALEVPVRFYRTEMGIEPVLEWLRGLEREDRRAIGMDLMRHNSVGPGNALGPKPEGRSLGSSVNGAEQPDCAVDPVFSPGQFGCASWLH
jgi:hypothetical protein